MRGRVGRAVEERLENDPEIGMYTLPGGMSQLHFAAVWEHLRATGIQTMPDQKHSDYQFRIDRWPNCRTVKWCEMLADA